MDGLTSSDVTLGALLLERLHARSSTVIREGDARSGAPTIADEATGWGTRLGGAGVRAGDRVVCALPAGAAFAAMLVAACEAHWTFVPVPGSADLAATAELVDASVVVGVDGAIRWRRAHGPPSPQALLLLATSGTTGAPRRLALSESNVRAVLAAHVEPLALEGAVLLSVLPWHHAFGLVLELLVALLSGAELVRDVSGGRDAGAMLAAARAAAAAGRAVTHLHAVPYTVRLLASTDAGREFLPALAGGLVGGAPIDAAIAAVLDGTRLRVGYGQTEASPGIALGAPGAWRPGTLGVPLGCEVRLDEDGVLAFRGPNACLGVWHAPARDPLLGARPAVLEELAAGRWVRTGDLAAAEPDGSYTFGGRAAESFKLENGRYVAPLPIEAVVRARFPQLSEVVLTSPDGVSLVLAVSTDGPLPEVAAVRPLLGSLRTRPLTLVAVPHDAWVRSPKGEIDRRFPAGRAPAMHSG